MLTAPLGLIGVTFALLIFRVPFGFVAMLGTIALAGMIMRNSVILVDQIEQDIDAGHDRWHAIIDATVRRFRPIVLTALAAVLAMIPLSRSAFFGPMAVAIMGGLTVATALTLLFLPALYAAWFKVKPEEGGVEGVGTSLRPLVGDGARRADEGCSDLAPAHIREPNPLPPFEHPLRQGRGECSIGPRSACSSTRDIMARRPRWPAHHHFLGEEG